MKDSYKKICEDLVELSIITEYSTPLLEVLAKIGDIADRARILLEIEERQ